MSKFTYPVRNGDTVESIAARCAKAGAKLPEEKIAATIRRENELGAGQLKPGQKLVITGLERAAYETLIRDGVERTSSSKSASKTPAPRFQVSPQAPAGTSQIPSTTDRLLEYHALLE